MKNWLLDLFSKQEKTAEQVDRDSTFERKVQANSWILDTMNEADELAKQAASADEIAHEYEKTYDHLEGSPDRKNLAVSEVAKKFDMPVSAVKEVLSKTAAYELGDNQEETIKKDYELCVHGISNYNLAEMLAEHLLNEKGLATLDFNEEKTKQLKYVEGNREAAEKKMLDLIGQHTMIDWKKKFEEFEKSKTELADKKDLYEPEFKPGKQNWEKKVNYKGPSDKERIEGMAGVGKEEEKGAVVKEASLENKATDIPGQIILSDDEVEEIGYNIAGRYGDAIAEQFKDIASGGNFEDQNPNALRYIGKYLVRLGDSEPRAAELGQKIQEYLTKNHPANASLETIATAPEAISECSCDCHKEKEASTSVEAGGPFTLILTYMPAKDYDFEDVAFEQMLGKRSVGSGMAISSGARDLEFSYKTKQEAVVAMKKLEKIKNVKSVNIWSPNGTQIFASLKQAFRMGDKLYYRGHPCTIKEISINPFSDDVHVDVDVEGRVYSLSGKELKQLGKEPLVERMTHKDEPSKEEPKKEEKAPVAETPKINWPSDKKKEPELQVAKKEASLILEAEIPSPWSVVKDETGTDVIARVEQSTNKKLSKEDLEKQKSIKSKEQI